MPRKPEHRFSQVEIESFISEFLKLKTMAVSLKEFAIAMGLSTHTFETWWYNNKDFRAKWKSDNSGRIAKKRQLTPLLQEYKTDNIALKREIKTLKKDITDLKALNKRIQKMSSAG